MLGGFGMKKRVPKCLAILAGAACLFGVVIATPSMAPRAGADVLPNGYDVTCTPNGSNVICNISGCPRVRGDEAGDVVHTIPNGQSQTELSKACGNTATETLFLKKPSQPFTYSVQGCRKHFPGTDDCGAWSDYKYNPPASAPAQVQCPAGSPVGSVPQGQQCPAAPQVDCPKGSPTPKAVSVDKCAAVAPTKCPAGSAADTVAAGQQCAAPANAVAVNITRNGLNANVAITNKSSLPAKCSYTATKNGGLGPQEIDRSIDVGANSTGTITDMLWPPLGTSYSATVKCTVTYDGKQTSIGQAGQNVSG
jgi:hypothetical protein